MIIHEFTPAVVPTSIIICWISYASSKIPANIKKFVSDRFINWSVSNRSLGWMITKGKLGLSEVSTFEAFGRKSIYFMFMRSIKVKHSFSSFKQYIQCTHAAYHASLKFKIKPTLCLYLWDGCIDFMVVIQTQNKTTPAFWLNIPNRPTDPLCTWYRCGQVWGGKHLVGIIYNFKLIGEKF